MRRGHDNYYFASFEEDRHRGEERRHVHARALLEGRADRPSVRARLSAAILNLAPSARHSLTDYPCRLQDGSIGRVAVVLRGGEWTMVCRVA
jgi:hypothetical protein